MLRPMTQKSGGRVSTLVEAEAGSRLTVNRDEVEVGFLGEKGRLEGLDLSPGELFEAVHGGRRAKARAERGSETVRERAESQGRVSGTAGIEM